MDWSHAATFTDAPWANRRRRDHGSSPVTLSATFTEKSRSRPNGSEACPANASLDATSASSSKPVVFPRNTSPSGAATTTWIHRALDRPLTDAEKDCNRVHFPGWFRGRALHHGHLKHWKAPSGNSHGPLAFFTGPLDTAVQLDACADALVGDLVTSEVDIPHGLTLKSAVRAVFHPPAQEQQANLL